MKATIVVGVLALAIAASAAAPEKKVPSAKEVAASYFEAVTKGDVDKANELSTVPFSLDRNEVLKTRAEIEEAHRKIVADKGQREVPEYTIEPTDKAPKLDPEIFPEYVAYLIFLPRHEEYIAIFVTKSQPPKVIGFSD